MSWVGTGIAVGGIAGALITSDAASDATDAQAAATQSALQASREGSERGLEFLEPYSEIGLTGLDKAPFLTDPQQQFDFLQNNPLFQASLEAANTGTMNLAAARGRISAGDTLQQLSRNVLLSASPLIAQQKQSIGDLLNIGTGVSRSQANTAIGAGSDISNLIASGGANQAAGDIAQGNIGANLVNNLLTAGIVAGGQRPPTSPAPIPAGGIPTNQFIYDPSF